MASETAAGVVFDNLTDMATMVARNAAAMPGSLTNGTSQVFIKTRPSLDPTCVMYDFMVEAVAIALLCVFGFTGNTLSIICLARDKSKTATPFLLVSLEVADTMFLAAVFLLRVATSVTRYADWEPIMPIFPYFPKYVFPCALIAETGTIYLTVLVTVNRYISVCRPYEAASLCSVRHAQKHVIVVAVLSVLYNIPRFFEFTIKSVFDHHRNRTVDVSVPSDLGRNRIYQILYSNVLYFIVMFLVPLVTLIILNTLLIKALRRTKKKRALMLTSSATMQSRSEDDITLVLIVVVVVFVVCQTPALVTQLLMNLLSQESRDCPSAFFYYERISDLMVVANSSINFIIYCFCSNKFRLILIQLVCGKKPEEQAKERQMATHATQLKVEDLEEDRHDKNGHAGTEESLL
jgi:hypothetical protein